jgi:hypothetical protein
MLVIPFLAHHPVPTDRRLRAIPTMAIFRPRRIIKWRYLLRHSGRLRTVNCAALEKREDLFAGSDALREALIEKILQAPEIGEPLQVVTGVVSEFDRESLGSRNSQRQRQAVIAAPLRSRSSAIISKNGDWQGTTHGAVTRPTRRTGRT